MNVFKVVGISLFFRDSDYFCLGVSFFFVHLPHNKRKVDYVNRSQTRTTGITAALCIG